MTKCHFCDSVLVPKLNFGHLPLANAFLSKIDQPEVFYRAVWSWCPKCELLQLEEPPRSDQMFTKDYPYRTSTSEVMLKHFEETAWKLYERYHPKTVAEIGASDGGMIQFLKDKCAVVGFEPSQGCRIALLGKGIEHYPHFDKGYIRKAINKTSDFYDLIYSANTLRSIPELGEILSLAEYVLSENGVLVIEEPYLPAIINHNEFDQFYDENVYCFTATSIDNIVSHYGLQLVDVENVSTHGGSMRYHIKRSGTSWSLAVDKMILREYDLESQLSGFMQNVKKIVGDLTQEVKRLNRVIGYGATAKSSTLLCLMGTASINVSRIYDNTPDKIGKFTPGTHIPIFDAKNFDGDPCNSVLLLAWNHADEIMSTSGTRDRRWITYIPEVRWL